MFVKNWMKLTALSLILLALFSLNGCGQRNEKAVKKIPVSAFEVKAGKLKEYLFYVGDIKAKDEAVVYPKVTGKILEKLIKEGTSVKKGEILAYVDRDEVGFKFEKAPVESPIYGVLGKLYVDIGTSVSPQIPVALVVNMETVKVRINVAEKDLSKVKEGQKAEIKVDTYPETVFLGVAEELSPIVDLESRTSSVEIVIPNGDYRLKPGMFARINILIKEKEDALIIPRDAIIRENNLIYVFVIREEGKVYKKEIKLGLNEGNNFEVVKGLNAGELLVTMGNSLIKEGDIVEVIR